MMFKGKDESEYIRLANLHVEVLNHALRNIPADKVRLHVCWGNYEGPHHCDAPMSTVLPIALRAKPQALLFESSNPRHAHEWTVFRDADIPEDKILIPGVLDSTTNFVEHPELVAQRICCFADIVGRERVLAGTDCGFSTFDARIVSQRLGAVTVHEHLARDEPHITRLGSLKNRVGRMRMDGAEYERRRGAIAQQFIDKNLGNFPRMIRVREFFLRGIGILVQPVE